MLDVFFSVKHLLKFEQIRIDNVIFALHYRVTRVVLVALSLLVSCKQYFGDPIDCIVDQINSRTIDMFCWIQSTYTVPALAGALVGEEVAHPGVANYIAPLVDDESHQYVIRHHKYYQWVALVLFLQSCMFYVPRYIWKCWEGGRVKGLVNVLNLPALRPDLKQERVRVIVDYFGRNFHRHNLYAYQFFLCELLNFTNVVGQFYLTESFLGHGFNGYGPRVVQYAQQDPARGLDPKDEVFPKVAKCTFHKFGSSGTIMRHDAICVLPLNILNEKIYVSLWFWLLALALISGCGLLYRMATFAHKIRPLILRARSRLASKDKVEAIVQRCRIGDWFILSLLAKNMDPFMFRDFINDLSPKLLKKEHYS
ncbi:innexin inx2-like isoform X2 [Panulirus ornatus]|uniref:innexin inx2-like isoform X2 n=1 Tax=Panulirus ornatus TaxID=150431 RepID=UPI003A8BC0CA